jgi:choline dehydrogenase-like flavoprotein
MIAGLNTRVVCEQRLDREKRRSCAACRRDIKQIAQWANTHPHDPHLGVPIGTLVSQDDYHKDPAKGNLGSYQWLVGFLWKPNGATGIASSRPDIWGSAFDTFMLRAAKHIGAIQMVGEMLVSPDNRIELSPNRDSSGYPVSKLTIAFTDDERALYNHAAAVGTSIMNAAEATETWKSPLINQHFMGGTIMGRDPSTSVTDSYGVAHEVPNVVIVGNTLFPTSAAVNPTFTTHAVTLRAVDHLLAHWPV